MGRQQNGVVVGEAQQAAVEQPVGRAGEGDTVADGVWAISFDRTDMRGLHFGTAAAVDQAQAGDGASIGVGTSHVSPEGDIAKFP